MTVHSEAQDKLFTAFPRKRGENLKAWFPRVARQLNGMARSAGWEGVHITPRRVRALWNHEARRIDVVEMRLFDLAERVVQLEQGAERRRGDLNEIRDEIRSLRSADRGGDPSRSGGATACHGRAGEAAGEGSDPRCQPKSTGVTVEELAPALPALKFSPRLH